MPYLIAGFPGVGKSHLYAHASSVRTFDLEPTPFRKQPDWPDNYLIAVEDVMDDRLYDLVLVATYPEVIKVLLELGYMFNLVYPDETQKDDYVARYRQRGNSEVGVQTLADMFESNVANLRAIDHPNCQHTVLKPGQYLSDVIMAL